MTIKIRKRNSYEYIYCLTFALYIFTSVLNSSLFSTGLLFSAVRVFCVIVLCAYFLLLYLKRISIIRLVVMGVVVVSCAVAALTTNRVDLILLALFIVCADRVDFRDIVKTSLMAGGLAISFVVLSSMVGIIPNYAYYKSDGGVAFCLGFGYYSSVPYTVIFLFIMYMYLRGKNIKWVELCIIFAGNYLLYRMTTVRLTFGIMIIALVLEIFLVKLDFLDLNKKAVRLFSTVAFPVFFVVVIVFTNLYIQGKPAWIYGLNSLLSGRLAQNTIALSRYPITLFGQYMEMIGNSLTQSSSGSYFYVDSGFFYSLMGYGVIFTIIFLLMYSYLYRYSATKNDKPLFIWLTCVLVFTLINNIWVSITTNPVLLIFGCLMQSNRNQGITKVENLGVDTQRIL